MRSSFKRILAVLFAFMLCGCSKSGVPNSTANNSTSWESGSLISSAESFASDSITSSSTSVDESSQNVPPESVSSVSGSESGITSSSMTVEESDQTAESGDIIEHELSPKEFPRELEEIPREYFNAASNQGTLADLNYTTYESFSYDEKSQELQKRAVVYLPYGYDESATVTLSGAASLKNTLCTLFGSITWRLIFWSASRS